MKYLIDAAAGAGLFLALCVVFVVDWLFFATGGPATFTNTLGNVTPYESPRDPKKLKIAVTPSDSTAMPKGIEYWDDMSKLLNGLGEGFRHDKITPEQMLANPKKLNDYNVLFFTCGRGGEELKDILFNFVSEGGILYASDYRYNAIATAFPDMKVDNLRGSGARQTVEANVADADLRDVLKKDTISLKFDLPEWKPAAFGGQRVDVLLQGKYKKYQSAETATAPLMVRFKVNKGTVIFTSFHNEAQNSEDEIKLLKHLVFSLITAGIDADISGKMEGFAPQRSNLLSTPSRNQSVSKTYDNKKKCTLRFALGFHNVGAKLRFNIKSPDGKEYTHDCVSTVILEVADAAPGTWTYTVTTLEVPYENLPFKTFVTEKN